MSWDWTNPALGSAANLSASGNNAAYTKTAAIDRAFDTGTAAKSSVTMDVWSGDGRSAWVNRLAVILAKFDGHRQAYVDGKDAVIAYAAAFNSLKGRIEDEQAKLLTAATWLRNHPFPPIPLVDPVGYAKDLVKRPAMVQDEIEATAAILLMANERQGIEDTFVAALTKAVPASWEQTRAAFAEAGLDSTDTLTDANIAAAMRDLALSISAGDHFDPKDAEALNTLLTMYGDDPEVAQLFIDSMGGEALVLLIVGLANNYGGQPEVIQAAQQIRDALTLASYGWDQDQADAFAESLFDVSQYGLDGDYWGMDPWSAIGYLYSNPDAPMSPEFSLSSAVQIDSFERPLGWPNYTSTAGSMYTADNLYEAEHLDEYLANQEAGSDGGGVGVMDPADSIFQHLAHYPDFAIEFLDPAGDPGLGAKRVEYWYGDRYWPAPSEWEGPAELWVAVENATGGPLAGDAYDPVQGERIAAITTNIMNGLAENGSFAGENFSKDAAQSLVGAISVYMDGFGAYAMSNTEGFTGDPEWTLGAGGGPTFEYYTWGPDGELRYGPNIGNSVFAQILGPLAQNTDGAEALNAQQLILTNLYLEAGNTPELFNEAMGRINFIDGLMDGAGVGETLALASENDAELADRIENSRAAVEFLIGLVPVTDILHLSGGAGYVAGQVIGGVESWALDSWTQSWWDNEAQYEAALSSSDWESTTQYQTAMIANAERLCDQLGIEYDLEDRGDDESYREYLVRAETYYTELFNKEMEASGTEIPVMNPQQWAFMYSSGQNTGELALTAGQGGTDGP